MRRRIFSTQLQKWSAVGWVNDLRKRGYRADIACHIVGCSCSQYYHWRKAARVHRAVAAFIGEEAGPC